VIAGFVGYGLGIVARATESPALSVVGGIISCAGGGWGCAASYSAANTIGGGGTLGDALKNGLIAGASAFAFQQIGGYFNEVSMGHNPGAYGMHGAPVPGLHDFGGNFLTSAQIAGQIASHAFAGGVIGALQGGKFGHGFVSAGITKGVMGGAGFNYSNKDMSAIVGRTAVAALLGGTSSSITGGKFANGAATAALAHLYNQEGVGRNAQKNTLDRDKIIDAHAQVRKMVHGTAYSDPDASIYLSKSDQEAILAYELMETLTTDKSSTSYVGNFVTADTFIYQDGLASRTFILEGYGAVKGGEFNYISVGMMAAHYNHSLFTVAAQSVGWNGLQLIAGRGSHNYDQMFSGAFWAGYGHSHYNRGK
jgi:hypothetical protein